MVTSSITLEFVERIDDEIGNLRMELAEVVVERFLLDYANVFFQCLWCACSVVNLYDLMMFFDHKCISAYTFEDYEPGTIEKLSIVLYVALLPVANPN